MGFRDELLLRGGLFDSKSDIGTGCQPVTSGRAFIDGDPRIDDSTGSDPRREKYSFEFAPSAGVIGRPFVLKYGAVAALRGDVGADCMEAMSCSGALGRRMPPASEESICGDWEGEMRGMEKEEMSGELLYDSAPESEPDDE